MSRVSERPLTEIEVAQDFYDPSELDQFPIFRLYTKEGAYLDFEKAENSFNILIIFTPPKHRGKGLAKALIHDLAKRAIHNHIEFINFGAFTPDGCRYIRKLLPRLQKRFGRLEFTYHD